ncbi:MAG: hypothetical protein R2867_19090 [Caldilineaceae bacterium]
MKNTVVLQLIENYAFYGWKRPPFAFSARFRKGSGGKKGFATRNNVTVYAVMTYAVYKSGLQNSLQSILAEILLQKASTPFSIVLVLSDTERDTDPLAMCLDLYLSRRPRQLHYLVLHATLRVGKFHTYTNGYRKDDKSSAKQ